MLEEIKKGMLAGLGAVFLTREKIEGIILRLVEEAKLSPEDARSLRHELLAAGRNQWAELEESLSSTVQKGLRNLDVANQTDLQDLKERVDRLEKKISIIENIPQDKQGMS